MATPSQSASLVENFDTSLSLHEPLANVVTSLLADEEAQAAAVQQLANLIDQAEGIAAEAVGKTIRDFGAMDTLLDLLERPETQQDALRVIGNLASNAVDSRAEETKRLLHELNAFPRVLPLIHHPTAATVVYALGAVQNMLTRPEYAMHMREMAAEDRLRDLLATSQDETLRHFANGCLMNMKAVLAPNFKPREDAEKQKQPELPPSSNVRSASRSGPFSRSSAARDGGGGSGSGELRRYEVPADNSCLFTTCALLCDRQLHSIDSPSVEQLALSASQLRNECAQLVLGSDDKATTLALLGFDDASAYGEWIRDEMHWGGEPEVSKLSEIFDVEITIAACDAMQVLRYGGGQGRKVVYMLYTGQHYDPLIGPPPEHRRLFPPAAERPKEAAAREDAALRIAAEHNEARDKAALERSLPAGSLRPAVKER